MIGWKLNKLTIMKQFNLEEYLKNPNRELVTRDGRKARIICTDRKGEEFRNIIALITIPTDSGAYETIETYLEDGKNSKNKGASNDDLFFAPNMKTGWVIVSFSESDTPVVGIRIYDTKQEAEEVNERSKQGCDKEHPEQQYVSHKIAKIEWEE